MKKVTKRKMLKDFFAPVENGEISREEFYASMTDEQRFKLNRILQHKDNSPEDVYDSLLYYFDKIDTVNFTYNETKNPDTDKISLIKLNFHRPLHGLIFEISISNYFENVKLEGGHLFINDLNDFIMLYHEDYEKRLLGQFVNLKMKEVLNLILQKIDILHHVDNYGFIGFDDKTAFNICDCICVYCAHFGIKLNNYMDFQVIPRNAKTYFLKVLDSKKLSGIKTIIIDKKLQGNVFDAESCTLYINSFYYFLLFTDNLLKFITYKVPKKKLNKLHLIST